MVGAVYLNPYVSGYSYAGRVRAGSPVQNQNAQVPAVQPSGTVAVAGEQAASTERAGNVMKSLIGPRRISSAGSIAAVAAVRPADPETPVEPVKPVTALGSGNTDGMNAAIPFMRAGMDPAEFAVRMRIQYVGVEDAQKAIEEGECQTCKQRKYQDGSDDPGVSFQTPTHISPDQAVSAVRGHEMEHVVREQAKAEREGRRVVSQSVTMHTGICPECGKVYVSGGTTRTTTAAEVQAEEPQESKKAEQAMPAAA